MNKKDDRTDVFGIPYKPPERDEAVAQYQRRSMRKLHIADWHKAEFERLEGELTTADFFDFDTERFLPAQAHADGALIQLAAGFDAFACAVAHHYGLGNPDRASLWEAKWAARLAEAAEHDLRAILPAVVEDPKFAGLKFYRNLAAHRGVIGEQQRGGEVEEFEHEARAGAFASGSPWRDPPSCARCEILGTWSEDCSAHQSQGS